MDNKHDAESGAAVAGAAPCSADSVEIGIGPTTSGRVIVQMIGGNEKVIAMDEAEKMLEVLKDAIRVAKGNPPNTKVSDGADRKDES